MAVKTMCLFLWFLGLMLGLLFWPNSQSIANYYAWKQHHNFFFFSFLITWKQSQDKSKVLGFHYFIFKGSVELWIHTLIIFYIKQWFFQRKLWILLFYRQFLNLVSHLKEILSALPILWPSFSKIWLWEIIYIYIDFF